MKKLLYLVAALITATALNAEVFDFTLVASESDYSIENAIKNTSESTDTKIVYDIEAGQVLTFVPTILTKDIEMTITNTSAKEKIFNMALGQYAEFGGKNGVLSIYNLYAGDVVTLHIANKSDKGDGTIGIYSGGEVSSTITLPAKNKEMFKTDPEHYDKNGYYWVDAQFTAEESTLVIKEISYGYRITSVTIDPGTSAVENVATDNAKAQKIVRDGQIIILKNGLEYNLLGTQLQ